MFVMSAVAGLGLVEACGDSAPTACLKMAAPDASSGDARPSTCLTASVPPLDAGPDSTATDAGTSDAGASDAGASDAGVTDAGATGSADAGRPKDIIVAPPKVCLNMAPMLIPGPSPPSLPSAIPTPNPKGPPPDRR